MVASRHAGTFPENVKRLVVVEGTGPPLVPPEQRPGPPERMRKWIEAGRAFPGRQPRRYESLDAAFRRMQEANPHLSPYQARHLTIHGANQNEDGTYSWKFDNSVHAGPALDLSPEDVRLLWRNIDCPVLLISGGETWQRTAIESGVLEAALSEARHEIIEDAGHWVQHDQLDVFVELISDFLGDGETSAG